MPWRRKRASGRETTPVITDLDFGTARGMRPLGDRRRRIRLEVVGSLWGALEVDRTAHLLNISKSGALIMSPVAAAVDSTQFVKLTIEGHEVKLSARVRHVQRVDE